MRYPIQPMPPDLWPAVREIYGEGIATGNATFEMELPEWEKWDASHHNHCRLIALEPREEAVAEISIPLEGNSRPGMGCAQSGLKPSRVCGSGGGFRLRRNGCARPGSGKSTVAGAGAGIGEEAGSGLFRRESSLKMPPVSRSHKSCDFREVGIRHRIGKLGDTWRDVMLLERRSAITSSS